MGNIATNGVICSTNRYTYEPKIYTSSNNNQRISGLDRLGQRAEEIYERQKAQQEVEQQQSNQPKTLWKKVKDLFKDLWCLDSNVIVDDSMKKQYDTVQGWAK